MKKFFTGLFIVAVVFVAAAIAVPFVVDINRFKDPILDIAQKEADRTISVGHLSWKLLPSLSVMLEDVAVQESREPGSPVIFAAKQLDLELRWAPLLSKKFEVKSIVLTSPEVRVRKDAEGNVSLEALPGRKPVSTELAVESVPSSPEKEQAASEKDTRPKKAKPPKKPLDLKRFSLSSLEIAEGSAEYREEKKEGKTVRLKLDQMSLNASDIAVGEKIRFKGGARIGGEAGFTVNVAGWMGPVSQETLDNKEWRLLDEDVRVTAEGADPKVFSGFPGMPEMDGTMDLDIHIRQEDARLTFDANIQGDALQIRVPGKFRKPAGGALRVKASGMLKGDRLEIERATLTLLSAKATLRNASYAMDTHDFEGTLNANCELDEMRSLMDIKGGAVAQGQATLDAEVSGNTDRLMDAQVEGTMELDSVRLKWPGVLKQPVEMKGNLSIQKNLVRLRGIALKVGRSDLRLDGKVSIKGSQEGQITLESDFLDVEELLGVLERPEPQVAAGSRLQQVSAQQPAPLPGKSKVHAIKALPATGAPIPAAVPGGTAAPASDANPKGLAKWSFQGTCKVQELVFKRNRLADLQGGLSLQDGIFTLSKLTATGYKGSLSTAVQVDLIDPTFAFRWGIRTTNLQINDLIEANSNFGGRVFGLLNAQLELEGRVMGGMDGLLQSLNGGGQVEVADMQINTVDMMNNLSVLTGLLGMRQPQADQTRFDVFRTPVQIQGGRIYTSNIEAYGNNFNMAGSGSVGFDRTLDYNLQVKLSAEMTERLGRGQLVQALLAQDGTMIIPFAVTGRLDGPPRFQPLWQNILTQQATYKLGEYLEGRVFKRKGTQPAQVPGPGEPYQGPYDPQEPASGSTSGDATLEELLTQILQK